MTPISRARLVQIARRAAAAGDRPASVPVPTGRRPKVVIVVDRQPPPDAPAPGTVTNDGGLLTLHVGRDWIPRAGDVRPVAERLLGQPVVEIRATTNAAGERARKRLRQVWRTGDLLASDRLDDTTTARLRELLDRM